MSFAISVGMAGSSGRLESHSASVPPAVKFLVRLSSAVTLAFLVAKGASPPSTKSEYVTVEVMIRSATCLSTCNADPFCFLNFSS